MVPEGNQYVYLSYQYLLATADIYTGGEGVDVVADANTLEVVDLGIVSGIVDGAEDARAFEVDYHVGSGFVDYENKFAFGISIDDSVINAYLDGSAVVGGNNHLGAIEASKSR